MTSARQVYSESFQDFNDTWRHVRTKLGGFDAGDIARETGFTREKVYRHLFRLHYMGLLTRYQRPGSRQPNIFRVVRNFEW